MFKNHPDCVSGSSFIENPYQHQFWRQDPANFWEKGFKMGHFKMFSLLLFLASSCHTQPVVESNLIIPSTPSSPSLPTSSLSTSSLTISPLAMAANCSQTRQEMFHTIKVLHKALHDVFLLNNGNLCRKFKPHCSKCIPAGILSPLYSAEWGGGAMWVKRGKKGWAMGTNSPQKTHFVPFSGLKSDFPAPGSY